MKKAILSLFALCALNASAQTYESVAMGPVYANQVYYKLSSQTQNAYPAASWDLAFNCQSAFSIGVRSNDHKGISVFQAASDLSAWDNINPADEATWTRLYNSDTNWAEGALDNGSATYGWGEYNPVTHHVYGTVVFVLKYADGSYKKLRVDDFWGGYTITYASWDGAAWSADTQTVIPNTDNPNQLYNYYSLQDNAAVVAEPAATEWDFVFTKYLTDIMGDGSMMYPVTGVLHHPDVTVAKNEEPNGMESPSLTFAEAINTIGFDWKTFNGAGYTVDNLTAYYVRYTNGTTYRLVFETFEGSTTGVTTFNYEDVTSQLSTIEHTEVTFGVFPNPSADKRIQVVFNAATAADNSVNIYNLNGAKVYTAKLAQSGFNNNTLELASLTAGVYVLEFVSGDFKAVRKIVLQ